MIAKDKIKYLMKELLLIAVILITAYAILKRSNIIYSLHRENRKMKAKYYRCRKKSTNA
jgi:hypothetical protein